MIRNYFKTAIRNLFRNKIYSFINIAGLSLGLACAMLIILYIKDEVSYDRFHTNGDNIYRVVTQEVKENGSKGDKDGNSGYFQGPRFTANIPEIRSFVRIQSGTEDFKNQNDVKSMEVLYVDSNFFSVFSFPLLSGNTKNALLEPNSVVLSEDEAKKQFGTVQALGKTILLKDKDKFQPYTVTGVAKRCPQNSSIKFEVLLPLKVSAEDLRDNMNWFNFFLNTFVVLNPNAGIKNVEARMKKVYETDAKEAIKIVAEKYGVRGKSIYMLQPFMDMHLSKDLPAQNGLSDASNPMFSYIFPALPCLFSLLPASISLILQLPRSLKRAKEIGIRKVVGGARRQLIIQFLGESFILCLIAFLLAIVILEAVLPVFNRLSNKVLALSYLFDARLVAGYIILLILTGLSAGFYPALVLSNFNPVQTLYSRFRFTGKNFLQKTLVIVQFALASFLIIATITIYAQFNFLTTEKLGYDDNNLVLIRKSEMNRNEAALLKQELKKDPNIIAVASKNRRLLGYSCKGEWRFNHAICL